MSYRRALLLRWSRRDRLAIVVLAAVVALLVGTMLVVGAAGMETVEIVGTTDSVGTAVYVDDPAAAPDPGADAVVLPVAAVTLPDGRTTRVVGVPPNASEVVPGLEAPPPGETRGPGAGAVALAGRSGTVTVETTAPPEGVLPGWWYVTGPETVDRIGTTGALVVTPAATGGLPPRGVPLFGVGLFFFAGIEQVLDALGAVAVGAGILVAVVVYSVTRMTVRDRVDAIAVLRATGAPPARILILFALRSLLVTAVGVTAGYAVGIVAPSAAVNLAVFVGVPTTLALQLTPGVVATLVPVLFGLVAVGVVGGVLGAVPAVRGPPAALTRGIGSGPTPGADRSRLETLRPSVLDAWSVLPTAATLTVFVAITLVAAALAGALAPIADADQRSIVSSGAAHPLTSGVDADYARVLQDQGVAASPEIFAFSVVDGGPFFTRGANYTAFAAVSDATLLEGRPPDGPDEAVVGADLASTVGIQPNDTVMLGGSTRAAVTRVRVVGQFRAAGIYDDQLVVPVRTARHITDVGTGRVNIIRFAGDVETGGTEDGDAAGVAVTDLSAPADVAAGERIAVAVTVRNADRGRQSRRVAVSFAGDTAERTVAVPAGATRRLEFEFGTPGPGTYRVRVRGTALSRAVRVVENGTLGLSALPGRGPPNASLAVMVRDGRDTPVENATLALGNTTARTDAGGRATVVLPAPGTYRLSASKAGYANATHRLDVRRGAVRPPVAALTVEPSRPDVSQRPTARLVLSSPWERLLSPVVTIRGPGTDRTTQVEIPPGEETTVTTRLSRSGPGEHDVVALVDGRQLATAGYSVRGDRRLGSVVASGRRSEVAGGGISGGLSRVLGNVEVLLGTLIGLTALATVASSTAAFARAVHARRRTLGIRRATGATPRQLLALVVADSLRIAVPATAIALVAGYAGVRLLATRGVLVAFGIPLVPPVSLPLFAATAGGAVLLALVGAAGAAASVLRVPPAQLFGDTHARPEGDDEG